MKNKIKKFIQDLKKLKEFSWLLEYTKPYIPRLVLLLILDMIATGITIGLAVVSKEIIDSSSSGTFIVYAIIFYIVMTVVSLLLSSASSLLTLLVSEKYSFGIRKSIFDKVIHSKLMDVEKYHTGDIMTRLTSDAGNVADGIIMIIPTILRLAIELLFTFITLYYFEPRLAIFALMLGPVITIISCWLGYKLKRLQLRVQETESKYRSFLQESVSNLLIVKSFTNEAYATEHLEQLRTERYHWVWKKNFLSVISSSIVSLSFQLGYIIAFAFGAYQISLSLITYGTMTVFLTLVNRVQSPILGIVQLIPKLISLTASASRIKELQEIPIERVTEGGLTPKQLEVVIHNLTFGYTEETVLENASAHIREKEFVALVGDSGIGKTTLIRLLMSFIDGREGDIQYRDEQGNVEDVSASIRGHIAYVPQGNTLFSGTIKENIRMGRLDATDEEIMQALEIAAGDQFVNNLPDGINTVIGERGHGLSEGQAQRIAIARALVRKAPFIILDEATSALDEKTELQVLEGIKQMLPRPTCLLITHRKSILNYCNREVKIDHKRLLERVL